MDVIAHTLWTNAIFYVKYARQRRMRYWAAFFGVAPDLIGFAPLFIYLLISSGFSRQWYTVQDHWTAQFANHIYSYTHSLVIFAAVLLAVTVIGNVWLRLRDRAGFRFWFFWPLLGWGLHILIDIPTHPDFYRTPLLFPLSDFRMQGGVSWAHPVFMAINYSLLVAVYIGLHYYQKWQLQKEIQS